MSTYQRGTGGAPSSKKRSNGERRKVDELLQEVEELKKIAEKVPALERRYKKLEQKILVDPLTGLLSEVGLKKSLSFLSKESKQKEIYGSLVFIDLDYLKRINDTFGHEKGDQLLRFFGRFLKRTLRDATDFIARKHGDEFLIFLPEVTKQQAEEMFEMRRHQFENEVKNRFPVVKFDIATSFSFGVAENISSLEKGILVADMRMYEDKDTRKMERD